MDHALLERYAAESIALKELAEDVKRLGAEVLAHLQEQKLDKAAMPAGTFSVVKSTRYEYPDRVEAIKLAYEDAKDHAILDGTAIAKETTTLRFQAAK